MVTEEVAVVAVQIETWTEVAAEVAEAQNATWVKVVVVEAMIQFEILVKVVVEVVRLEFLVTTVMVVEVVVEEQLLQKPLQQPMWLGQITMQRLQALNASQAFRLWSPKMMFA